MKRLVSILGVTALVTAIPGFGLIILFFHGNRLFSWFPRTPLAWHICSICFTVSVMCLLAFLFLYLSGKLGKEKPFKRYLPAWLAIGLIGCFSVVLILYLLYNAIIAVGIFTFGWF